MMAAKADPGFDVATAITNLQSEAVRLGVELPERCSFDDLYGISFEHVALHGVQTDSAPKCLTSPCRLGGVCFALHELLEYQRESGSPRTKAVIAVALRSRDMHTWLREQLLHLGADIRALVQSGKQQHEWETKLGTPGRFHNHALTCVLPRDTLKQSVDLLRSLEKLTEELPALVESPELSQPPARKRSTHLLTAVYRHLRWGGMTHREIAALVPDGMGGDAEDRARHRVKFQDARSLVPADVALCDPGSSAAHSSSS